VNDAPRGRRSDILDVAWRLGLLARLKKSGGEYVGGCPKCGGRDRFSVNRAKGLWNCRGCATGGDAIDLVRHLRGSSFAEAVEMVDGSPPTGRWPQERPAGQEDGARLAHWLWGRRKPITGSVAEIYLRQARGYGGPIPPTLAYLPPSNGHPTALIAALGMATEPEPGELEMGDDAVKAVQLVKLKPDGGGKADIEPNKIIIGKGTLGSPIMLAPPNDLLGLAICEGVEDALSVHKATGLGAWASGGATRMPALADAVPDYIDLVIIVADRDSAGVKGADGLADGLRRRGIKHRVTPLEGGRPHEAR
jgi:putative DNA primase/helicase